MTKLTPVAAALCLAGLAACGPRGPVYLFEGQEYAFRAVSASEDDRSFIASAKEAAGREAGALQAARFAATEYCLDRFGGSDILWAGQDPGTPDVAAPETFVIVDGSLQREGRCIHR